MKVSGRTTVSKFKQAFKDEFKVGIRVYDGKSLADESATLSSIKKTQGTLNAEVEIHGSMKIANIEKMLLEQLGIVTQIELSSSRLADDNVTIASLRNKTGEKVSKSKVDSRKSASKSEVSGGSESLPHSCRLSFDNTCCTYYNVISPFSCESFDDIYLGDDEFDVENFVEALKSAKEDEEVNPFELSRDIAYCLSNAFINDNELSLKLTALWYDNDNPDITVIDDDVDTAKGRKEYNFKLNNLDKEVMDINKIPENSFEFVQMKQGEKFPINIKFDKKLFIEEYNHRNYGPPLELMIDDSGSFNGFVMEYDVDEWDCLKLKPGIYCGLIDKRENYYLENLDFKVEGAFDPSKLKVRYFDFFEDCKYEGRDLHEKELKNLRWLTYNGNNVDIDNFLGHDGVNDFYRLQFYIFQVNDDGDVTILAKLLDRDDSVIIRPEFYDELQKVFALNKKINNQTPV